MYCSTMACVELVKRVDQIQEIIKQGQDNERETHAIFVLKQILGTATDQLFMSHTAGDINQVVTNWASLNGRILLRESKVEQLCAVKHQVDLLKTWIMENNSGTEEGCCQTESKSERIPDGDSQKQWRVCSCNQVACMTCEAERQATISATQWFDNQSLQSPLDVDAKREKDYWDRISHCVKQDVGLLYAPCIVDENYHTSNVTYKYVVMLHPHLSATGTTINPKSMNACGVIALLFAESLVRTPPQKYLLSIIETNPICAMVSRYFCDSLNNAIKDGNDLYDANCDGKTDVILDPSYTVLISSHMGVSLAEQITLDPNRVIPTLISSILQLEDGHILLFFRMEDYKVLSVINYRSQNMMIFDGQLHRTVDNDTGKEIEYGGIFCQIVKDYYSIFETLTLLELHCGKFRGVCKVAIVKVDT